MTDASVNVGSEPRCATRSLLFALVTAPENSLHCRTTLCYVICLTHMSVLGKARGNIFQGLRSGDFGRSVLGTGCCGGTGGPGSRRPPAAPVPTRVWRPGCLSLAARDRPLARHAVRSPVRQRGGLSWRVRLQWSIWHPVLATIVRRPLYFIR